MHVGSSVNSLVFPSVLLMITCKGGSVGSRGAVCCSLWSEGRCHKVSACSSDIHVGVTKPAYDRNVCVSAANSHVALNISMSWCCVQHVCGNTSPTRVFTPAFVCQQTKTATYVLSNPHWSKRVH